MSFPQSGIEAVVKNLDGFLADVGRMDKAIQGVGSNTSAITDWNNKITSVTANVAKVVGAAAVGATAAFGGFIADSVRKSTDLQQSIADIGALFGKTGDELKPLSGLIRDLGLDPNLKVSSTEAAQAIELLARNGLTMTEIIDGAAESTVLLANATNADFGTAADIATDAMAIFNIEAANMDKAVNGISGVTIASKFSINDYKLALAQAGGVAGAVGVSFDDFNTTIAGISPLFDSGSDAGTSFKTFLQRLIPASGPATDAMRDLGLFTGLTKDEFEKAQDKIVKYKDQLADLDPTSKKYGERSEDLRGKIAALESSLVTGSNAFFDANGQMKDMDQIADALGKALSGLSEEQTNAALTTIFGTDAMRAAIGVSKMGEDGYHALAESIGAVDAAQMAAARNDTLKGSLEILSGIIEALQQDIGLRFEPALRSITDWASDFLSKNADRIVDFFGKFADGLKSAADRLIPVVESWLPKLEEKVNDGSFSIESMVTKVGEIVKAVKDFTDKIIGAIKPVADWITKNYELDDILNGILAVITVSLIPAIVSLVTTLAPVIALFTTVAELSSRMTDGQKQFAIAVGAAVFALPPLISAITTITGVIGGVISVGSSLVGIITGGGGVVAAMGALLNPVGLVVAAVAGLGLAWATDFGGIRTKTIEVVGDVSRSIGQWSTDTANKFQETQGKIGTTLASWSSNIGSTLSGWSANIGGVFSRLKDAVVGDNKKLTDDSLKEFGRLASQGSTSAQQLRDSFGRLSGETSSVSSGNYRTLTNESVASLARLFSEGSASAQRLSDTLKTQSSGASGTVRSNLANLVSESLTSLSRLQNEGGTIFTRFRENATSKVGDMARDIPSRFRELVDAGLRIFDVGKWVQAGADIIGGIMEGLARAATAPLRWIENFASGLIGLFTSKLRIGSPSKVFDEFGVNIMEGLEGGLESRSSGVLDYMNDFSSALVQTAAEAQRLADKEFKKLTDSATAAYNGFAVTAGDIARLSQNIDQSAIAAAEAARKAREEAAKASQQQATAQQAATDSYFGFGRVTDLINQIRQSVNAQFEVSGVQVRSTGIDTSGLSTSGATGNAIAQLQLLAGTIQQNAQAATNADDRNRLSALYMDVTGRILPLLRNLMSQQQTSEATAINSGTGRGGAIARVQSAFQPLIDSVTQFATRGLDAIIGPNISSVLQGADREIFDYFDRYVEATGARILDRSLSPFLSTTTDNFDMSKIGQQLTEMLGFLNESLGYTRRITSAGVQQATAGANLALSQQAAQGTSALLQALPALAGSTNVQTSITTGDINNNMDLAVLLSFIQQAVAEALP